MKLLVVRHGIAADKDAWRGDDEDRPLTDDGRAKMQRNAAGLTANVSALDALASSPLVRARQTAEVVSAAYGGIAVETLAALRPDADAAALVAWLRKGSKRECVAVVGHEPHLGVLVTYLLSGGHTSSVELKKGGACLLQFDDAPAAGEAVMLWLLTPAQLRQLHS